MNPVLKRPEIWVLGLLTLAGIGFVLKSQRGLDEELKKPAPPTQPGPSTGAATVRFDLDSVVRRETEAGFEIEIAGTVRNGGKTELDLDKSARLKVDGETRKPLFLASNESGMIPAGAQRKVILPFVIDTNAPEATLNLEIADWSGSLR